MEKEILDLENEQISMKQYHYVLSHHVGTFSIHNTKAQFESMYGTEKELLYTTLKEVKKLEQANDLFNFYNKHKGEL